MGLLKRPIYFALLFLLLQFSCHFVSSFKILNADPASSSSPRRPIVDNDMKMPHQFHHPRHSNSLGARASFFPISSATTQPNAVRFNPTRAFPVAANSTAAVPLSAANDVPFPMPCRLPPDFWCDEPTVALTCTGGTLSFCEAYKRNQRGRKLNMKLAFETACPDSAGFVVNRLYPRVLNNKELASFVEVKAFPWGLAKRLSGQQIRCHHGPRECLGNRLTSCALNYYQWDRQGSERMLFCFMNHMMARGDPEQGMLDCLAQNWADQKLIREIMQCAHSVQVAAFQAEDERATEQILPRRRPRFVPFISLNSKSNIEMQAPLQLLLPEKIRHWNKTLAFDREERWKFTKSLSPPSIFNSAAPSAAAGQCDFPPEFWCSDPEITRACFNAQLCDQFQRTNFGHPVELRIIYNSQFDASRDYLFRVVRAQLLDPNVAPKFGENAGKVRVILEPAHLTRMALNECGLMLSNTNRNQNRRLGRGCARRIVEICIVNIVEPLEERNRHLLCLNALPENYEQQQFQITGADWATNCFHADSHRERILQCANSEAIWMGQNAHLATRQGQSALGPEPRRTDPWVLVNGYSLSTVQNYANVLDQMVCLWYRGPGHDRSQCGRCDYEPTHC